MARYLLNKSVEAARLNKNTLIPVPGAPEQLPFGARLDKAEEKGERLIFWYLGQPYSARLADIASALDRLPDPPTAG